MSAPGYNPAGPGGQRCCRCGKRISTNALARAAHDRKHAGLPATGNARPRKARSCWDIAKDAEDQTEKPEGKTTE
jgi:hypothetical protein